MSRLDCNDVDSILTLLADAIGTTPAELERALRDFDEAKFEALSEDPWELMPREVLELFGADVETVAGSLDGAYYFHGTRAVDPEAFRRRGILPLDQMIEELWATLRELADNEINGAEWAAFRRSVEADAGGHSGYLYRLKTGGRIHFGPFALLVREVFFDPQSTGSHDYLGCPEIVQDMARCFFATHGIDLEKRFCDASRPCIVKFRSRQLRPGAINAALWYAYAKLRDGEIRSSINWAFDGDGEPVPAEDVVAVEVAG